jgi:DNA-binding GntR family transcriptional regulator
MAEQRAGAGPVTDVPTVDRTSVREQVRRILRAQVASGVLVPGRIYSAVVLGESLGVSATPVREAMLDLANAGLVEAVRNRGFRILTVSDEDLDEIVQLRLMLEVPPLEQIVATARDEELDALAIVADQIVDAARRQDLPTYVLVDQTFHMDLLRIARNRRLLHLVAELRDQTQLLGLRRLGEAGELVQSGLEHQHILEAVRARDVDAAKALMTRHIEHARGIWAGRSEPSGSA